MQEAGAVASYARDARTRGSFRGRVSTLDELLRALNGGEHENDLIVTGSIGKVTEEQPIIGNGKATFTLLVVR